MLIDFSALFGRAMGSSLELLFGLCLPCLLYALEQTMSILEP